VSESRTGPYNFFVVDDSQDMINVVLVLLETAGHHVFSDRDPERALNRIIESPPDCVLVDVRMPRMNGLDLCREIRRRRELDETRLVLFSNYQDDCDIYTSTQLGISGFIRKSIIPQTFASQLEKLVQRRRGMGPPVGGSDNAFETGRF